MSSSCLPSDRSMRRVAGCDHRGVPVRHLVLASASPARLRLLTQAGFAPEVLVSGVDEAAITAADPSALVLALATAKASAVAATVTGPIVIGCDSLLDVDGEVHGKAIDGAEATARLQRLRG